MVDSGLLYKHSETQREIRELEINDENRKSLIRLAILRMITLRSVDTANQNNEVEELVAKNHEYEVLVDKLKQEFSTKEKLQTSKIETMKDEISRLKLQLKTQSNTTPLATSGIFSSGSQWGFRGQDSFHSSALNSKLRMKYNDGIGKTISSPTYPINIQNASENSSLILTPLKKKKFAVPNTKREYTNYNMLKKKHEDKKSESEEPMPSSVTTPTKDNSQQMVTRSRSINKMAESTPLAGESSEIDQPSANASRNTSMVSATDDDTFASANSSLCSVKSFNSAKSENRKKRLKLWKSGATRVTLDSETRETDILDDVNLNSLTYYQDANFEPDSSPPKRPHKRSSDEVTPAPTNVKRKKKNVFRID